jgi:hypothetical protein
MELAMLTIFLYILPAILTVFVILNKMDEATVLDLIGIILIAILPLANLFGGYVGGFISLCESKRVNNFLNRRIK